jgi:hypothetical protein
MKNKKRRRRLIPPPNSTFIFVHSHSHAFIKGGKEKGNGWSWAEEEEWSALSLSFVPFQRINQFLLDIILWASKYAIDHQNWWRSSKVMGENAATKCRPLPYSCPSISRAWSILSIYDLFGGPNEGQKADSKYEKKLMKSLWKAMRDKRR